LKYLIEYGLNEEDLLYIKNHYNKNILSNIIYLKDNVIDVINVLKEKEIDYKYLLLNRLDIFLIDIDDFKKKINKYNIESLREDFSIFS